MLFGKETDSRIISVWYSLTGGEVEAIIIIISLWLSKLIKLQTNVTSLLWSFLYCTVWMTDTTILPRKSPTLNHCQMVYKSKTWIHFEKALEKDWKVKNQARGNRRNNCQNRHKTKTDGLWTKLKTKPTTTTNFLTPSPIPTHKKKKNRALKTATKQFHRAENTSV